MRTANRTRLSTIEGFDEVQVPFRSGMRKPKAAARELINKAKLIANLYLRTGQRLAWR